MADSEKTGGLELGEDTESSLLGKEKNGTPIITLPRRSSKYFGAVKKKQLCLTILLTFATTVLVALSVFLGWFIIPSLIKVAISRKIALSPEITPELYDAWIHPPIPVYLKIHLFNVTNPTEIKKGGLPSLQELGPYVFLENRTKVDISHDESSDTIQYSEFTGFQFEPELSGNASLDDILTIINVPFVSAAITTSNLPWPFDGIAKTVISQSKEPLFVNKTAREILFQGWKVPFLEKIEQDVGVSLLPNNTFGYFADQNNVVQGPFVISRGTYNKSTLGSILSYKNKTNLDFWGDPNNYCNKIRGTDGTIFPPAHIVTKSSTLYMFRPEVCVTTYATFSRDYDYNGIAGYRFSAPISMIMDPRKSEQNRCYCTAIDEDPDQCYGTGALDLSVCKDGAPVALSGAHFLDGETIYVEQSGLTPPDREKHETFIVIEPLTGVVVHASKKLQINLNLKRVKGYSSLRKIPEILFPLFWAEECASLDSDLTFKIKTILFVASLLDFLSRWGLPTFSLIVSILYISSHLNYQKSLK